jgi:ADP-ribosylglycohydrolase
MASTVSETALEKAGEAAVLGALVQNAAALSLHWVYDQKEIANYVAENKNEPAFCGATKSSYIFNKKSGDISFEGELLLIILRIIKDKQTLDVPEFIQRLLSTFGPGGSYHGYVDSTIRGTVLNLMNNDVEFGRLVGKYAREFHFPRALMGACYQKMKKVAMTIGSSSTSSVELDDETRAKLVVETTTIANTACPEVSSEQLKGFIALSSEIATMYAKPIGSSSTQCAGFASVIPLVVHHAGLPEFNSVLQQSIRLLQANDDSVIWESFGGRVLEAVLLGKSLIKAINANLLHLDQPFRGFIEAAVAHARNPTSEDDYLAVATSMGTACDLQQGVPVGLYLLLRFHTQHSNFSLLPSSYYTDVMNANMLVGGDTTARGLLMGAIAAALHPRSFYSNRWLYQMDENIREEAKSLVSHIHQTPTVSQDSDHVHVEVHPAHN